ncbi:hypothetical protein EEB19_00195 [Gordonia sp. OPL2]|nr:hypothetical protein EEB19_00195 [Gordonia sp. OPL2]
MRARRITTSCCSVAAGTAPAGSVVESGVVESGGMGSGVGDAGSGATGDMALHSSRVEEGAARVFFLTDRPLGDARSRSGGPLMHT